MTIATAIASVFVVIFCHWVGLFFVRGLFVGTSVAFRRWGAFGSDLSFGAVVVSLILLILADIAVCALFVQVHDSQIAYRDAFLFSIGNFTTVGQAPPDGSNIWPLAGPLIAMCGIFIFGWTTSFLVDCYRAARKANDARRSGTD
jgi:hypothetical protein